MEIHLIYKILVTHTRLEEFILCLTTTNQYGTNIYSLIDYVNIMDLNLSLIPDSTVEVLH